MKLSIVVPVYNVADYLPRCVSSLLAQNLRDCEILLVDDGSTDGKSGELCDAYAEAHPALIRAIHKPNGGLGDARNAGLEAATGEYVLFIDSDDYIASNTMDILGPWMEQGVDVGIFGFWVDQDGVCTPGDSEKLPVGCVTTLAEFPVLLLASPTACCKLWRRSLFLDTGIRYPSRVWYEDLATSGALMASARTITATEERLYYYVVREGSITRNGNVERNLEILDAVERLTGWFRSNGLYDQYREALEALTVYHVLLTASVRVIRAGGNKEVLHTLAAYTRQHYPQWPRNPYIKTFPGRHRLLLNLLRLRMYRAVWLLFALRGG